MQLLMNMEYKINSCCIVGTGDIKSNDGKAETAKTGYSRQTKQVMFNLIHAHFKLTLCMVLENGRKHKNWSDS